MNKTILSIFVALVLVGAVSAEQVTVDFSSVKWQVPPDLYGTHVSMWGGAGARLDTNNDGVADVLSDYQAHRNAINEARITYLRRDMDLASIVNEDLTFNHHRDNAGNIDIVKSQVAWAAASNKKILLETTFMPSWLAKRTSACASRYQSCEPDNYEEWGRLLVRYLDEVGCDDHPGTCEIEVWNEPYLKQFWMSDGTCQERIDSYIRLYTNTYASIKAAYPSVQVGGPSGYIGEACGKQLLTTFLQRVPASKVDFVTVHAYGDSVLPQKIEDTMELIRANGHGKNVKITELGVSSSDIEVSYPRKHEFITTSAFVYAAANEPTLTSIAQFQWATDNKYSDGKPYYELGPWRRELFSEQALDNKKYTGLYVSKNMATMHPALSNVVRTTSPSSDILVLATASSNGRYITIVNRHWADKAGMTLALAGVAALEVRDVDTGAVYPVVNGVASIGTLPAFIDRHFVVVSAKATSTNTQTTGTDTIGTVEENIIHFESEHGVLQAPFETINLDGATGITVPNGVSGTGVATFTITVPETATYALWGRTIAPSPDDDSFFVRVDNGGEALWDTPISNTWEWSMVSNRGDYAPKRYSLTKGQHTITVRSRENGAAVEEFKMTSDLSWTPTNGQLYSTPTPVTTPQTTAPTFIRFEAENGVLSGPFRIEAKDSAGGITVPNGVSGSAEARYTVNVEKSGTYVLWGRTIAPTPDDDSFFVSVDGGSEALWDTPISTRWTWSKVSNRGEYNARQYYLSAGTHTVVVRSRENGVWLEEMQFGSDENYLPVAR